MYRPSNYKSVSKLILQKRWFSNYVPLGEKDNSAPLHNVVQPTESIFKISELKNGIKVASVQDGLNKSASVGIYIKSGTRNENSHTSGASFFLKRLGFQSTNSRTSLRLARELENQGATYRVACGREHTMYASEFPVDQLENIVPILSDVVSPALLDWEVRDEIHPIEDESKALASDPRTLIFDLLHQVAYKNVGLGNALIPPQYNLHHLDSDELQKYINQNYTPDRVTIVATGNVDHNKLVQIAESSIGSLRKVGESSSAPEKSRYVGGNLRIASEGNTYVAVAFEGTSSSDKDAHAYATLQFLLGGAHNEYDGIGNGATSEFYRQVSQGDSKWLSEISAFNINYSDSGLFGVYGVATKGNGARLQTEVSSKLKSVLSSINEAALHSAKNRYKADLFFGTESRTGLSEFLANQAITSGNVDTVSNVSKKIDQVSLADVQRVAKKVLSSKPTIVTVGEVHNIPEITNF